MPSYKSKTKKAYDLYHEKFDEKFESHFQQFVRKEADDFLRVLKGNKIIDFGSGPGNHAAYFKKQGLDVLCIDISETMARTCRKKGLSTVVMDIENLGLKEKSYDAIWAYAILLHIPKENIENVIYQISKVLKPNGLLALALKEGEGQGFETHENYPDAQRWFTYYGDEEVKRLFSESFKPLLSDKINVKNEYVFLRYIFELK